MEANDINWEDLDLFKFTFFLCTGTAALEVISHPSEIIKTRLQIQKARLDTTSMHMYKNSWDATRKLIKYEGVRGFWKGYGIKLATLVPENFIYYGAYEISKSGMVRAYRKIYNQTESGLALATINFLGGASAEICSAGVWMPTDIISQKLQIQGPLKQKAYKNAYDCILKTYQLEGIRGFYRGIGATLLTYVPSGAVTWMSYEFFKNSLYKMSVKYIPSKFQPDERSHLVHILAGAGSGVCCGIVANPFDIAKTRLQVQYIAEPTETKNMTFNPQLNSMQKANYRISTAKYRNTFDVFRAIIKEETIMGFTKGLLPQICFRVPMCALSFSVYEFVKALSHK